MTDLFQTLERFVKAVRWKYFFIFKDTVWLSLVQHTLSHDEKSSDLTSVQKLLY